MDNQEKVAPSELHRQIEQAAEATHVRTMTITRVLDSENLAVIRRIPELLNPLSDEEKELIVVWAEKAARSDEITKRDFTVHFLINCGVSAEVVMSIVERFPTSSQSTIQHLEPLLDEAGNMQERLKAYYQKIAESLIAEERVPSRDRGRHMLITAATTAKDWQELARRFSRTELPDLRQGVLERFLEECRDRTALTQFAEEVISWGECFLITTQKCDREDARWMHWVLTCLQRIDAHDRLRAMALFLQNKFNTSLPGSVRFRIAEHLPASSLRRSSSLGSRHCRQAGVFPTNIDPSTVDEAVHKGWTIHKDNEKQVILVKDGRSITRYR